MFFLFLQMLDLSMIFKLHTISDYIKLHLITSAHEHSFIIFIITFFYTFDICAAIISRNIYFFIDLLFLFVRATILNLGTHF